MTLISDSFLKRLKSIEIRITKKSRAFSTGNKRSVSRGSGDHFHSHRAYSPGDDLRFIDWNIYARTEKYFLKLFSSDTAYDIFILIDVSASMSCGTPSKMKTAQELSAALSYISLSGQDRVCIIPFSSTAHQHSPKFSGQSQIMNALKFIETISVHNTTSIADSLTAIAAKFRHGAVFFIISDFWDEPGFKRGISSIAQVSSSLQLIHILSPEEIEPSQCGHFELKDSETGEKIPVFITPEILASYSENLSNLQHLYRNFTESRNGHYLFVSSDNSLESIIFSGLKKGGILC